MPNNYKQPWAISTNFVYYPSPQTCQEDLGRKDSSSDSELKMSQHLLDQELLVHQNRLIQLLDQGDNEIFADQETPILTADVSGKILSTILWIKLLENWGGSTPPSKCLTL